MSTDHQQYSIANQEALIAEYAELLGYEVVRSYVDEGKSGLTLADRPGLSSLLDDVANGRADFSTVLVYDISRWGRFQDTDESAYYEFACRRAGITVEYCAEPFCNSTSPLASVIKALKRVMAGEYSRELSAKVAASKRRYAEMGFSSGSTPGYGLRRVLLDAQGRPRQILEAGQCKWLQTDHVRFCPGPEHEQRVVRWMYRQVADHGHTFKHITRTLNAKGIPSHGGKPWTHQRVINVLTNERYVGTIIYGKTSVPLRGRTVRHPRESWLRVEGAHTGIVPRSLFDRVQHVIAHTTPRLDETRALDLLRELYARHGRLTGKIIDRARGMPGSAYYRHQFGSLMAAYERVGYTIERQQEFLEGFNDRLMLAKRFRVEVAEQLRRSGATVSREGRRVLIVNECLSVIPLIGRYMPRRKVLRCIVQLHAKPDWVLVGAMDQLARRFVSFHLAPGGKSLYLFGSDPARHPERFAATTLEPLLALLAQPGGPTAAATCVNGEEIPPPS